MENEIQPTVPPVQPQSQTSPVIPLPSNQSKVPLFSVFGLVIVVVSVFVGIQIGKSQKFNQQPITVFPATSLTTPASTDDSIAHWKTYTINSNSLTFMYPPDRQIMTDIDNSTELKADEEYWVAYPGTDQIFLDVLLYKSPKSSIDWWDSEGKIKFEKIAESEKLNNPPLTINLTYETKSTIIDGKEALAVTVFSDYVSPHTPEVNNLIIFQNQGYVTMVQYHQISDNSTIATQILSTFKFTN